jgi:hypothetical protein
MVAFETVYPEFLGYLSDRPGEINHHLAASSLNSGEYLLGLLLPVT